jgi:hypothetical protein
MLRRRSLVEASVSSNRRLLAMVLVVRAGRGLTGVAFVGTMHLLQRLSGPPLWDDLPRLFILIGVGVCVALLTRILGNPGDVELVVNNIHVLSGRV